MYPPIYLHDDSEMQVPHEDEKSLPMYPLLHSETLTHRLVLKSMYLLGELFQQSLRSTHLLVSVSAYVPLVVHCPAATHLLA